MKTIHFCAFICLPILVLALLFSSCSYVQLVNKRLETPSATITETFTPTDTPTPVPTATPTPLPTRVARNVVETFQQAYRQGKRDFMLWGFNEFDSEGWKGKVSYSEEHPSEGKGCLKIDTTNSRGWNEDLAFVAPSRMGYYQELYHIKKISLDLFVPKGSLGLNGEIEVALISSGPVNNWAVHKDKIKAEGINHLVFDISQDELRDVWKLILVVNARESLLGPIYLDQVTGTW